MVVEPHSVLRTSQHIRRGGDDAFIVLVQRAGQTWIEQDGHVGWLREGAYASHLWRTTAPQSVTRGLWAPSDEARELGEVLRAVKQACPKLADLIRADGGLAPHYLLSVDGVGFATDMTQVLKSGTHLLLLSADAGG